MPELELTAGVVEYQDTGGDGPVVVLLHGLMMDGSVWRKVVADLAADYRCVVPTLPLGSHRRPMRADADLSIRGMANLVGEFLDELDLHDVTLVMNDWGGAQILLAEGGHARVAKLGLVACEAFDNFPPGFAARMLARLSKIPGGLTVAVQGFRSRAFRRAPGGFGWMSKRPVPDEVTDNWFGPLLRDAAIRRDLRKYSSSVPDKATLLGWAEKLRGFDRPALVAWAVEDRLMPREHGARLAELLPQGVLVEIPDSYTLIPEDQPEVLTTHLRELLERAPAR